MFTLIDKIIILKRVPIFSGFDAESLKILSGISEEVFYNSGELIFEEGEAGDALYIVINGTVKIFKQSDSSALSVIEANGFFGEFAVLGNENRSASAIAVSDTDLLVISKDKFHSLLFAHPLLSLPIFDNLISRLVKHG